MATEGFNQTDTPTEDSASTNRNTFEAYMLATFSKKIKKHFDMNYAFLSQATDFWPSLSKLLQTNTTEADSPNVRLPVARIKLTGIDAEAQTYSPATMRRMRMFGNPSQNSNTRKAHSLVPTKFELDVTFYTQSLNELMYLLNRWRFAVANSGDLNFTVDFDGIEIDVKVQAATQLQIPEKEEDNTRPALYEAVASFTLNGFMSDVMGADKAPEFPVFNELTVEYYNMGDDPEEVAPFQTETRDLRGDEVDES